mgnify:CR=1 FL=1
MAIRKTITGDPFNAAKAGDTVDLRAEMDVLCVLSNTPHPMDPTERYAPGPLRVVIWQADAVAAAKSEENLLGTAGDLLGAFLGGRSGSSASARRWISSRLKRGRLRWGRLRWGFTTASAR